MWIALFDALTSNSYHAKKLDHSFVHFVFLHFWVMEFNNFRKLISNRKNWI